MENEDKQEIIDKELSHFGNKDLEEIKDEETKSWLRGHIDKAWTGIRDAGKAVKRETIETVVAAKIFLKILSDSEISDKEIEFLKDQSVDIVKALALIGLQAVPGSSIGIIALEKFAKSKGFTVLPKAQEIPNKNTTSEDSTS
jgi:hypothetical protein